MTKRTGDTMTENRTQAENTENTENTEEQNMTENTENTNSTTLDVDAILARVKGTNSAPKMKAKDRAEYAATFVGEHIVADPDAISADKALEALIEAFSEGSVSDPVVVRFVEDINTTNIKNFARKYNAEFGAERTTAKVDDVRAMLVSSAEAHVDREEATAEEALFALLANADTLTDDERTLVRQIAGENAETDDAEKITLDGSDNKRQYKRFGRDWRREQTSPASAPRSSRFDAFDARLDALAERFDAVESAIQSLTDAVNKLAK